MAAKKKEEKKPSRLEGMKRIQIFRMILDNELTLPELDEAFKFAFKGAVYDPEKENHIQFDLHCKAEIFRLKNKEKIETEKAARKKLEEDRERAKVYLLGLEPPIDPTPLPDFVLDEVWRGLDAEPPPEGEKPPAVYYHKDLDAFVTLDGSVVHYPNIQRDDRVKLFEYIGDRMSEVEAKIEGLEAEKAKRILDIETSFNTRIKKEYREVTSLRYIFKPMAMDYLREVIASDKSTNPAKSIYVGLLCIGTKIVGGSLEIPNLPTAALWVRENCPEALTFVPKIIKKGVPTKLRQALPDDCGMFYVPKTDEFFMVTGKGSPVPAGIKIKVGEEGETAAEESEDETA